MDGTAPRQRSFVAQAIADLAPFPGRAALTWRIALLCAIVAAAAMMYEIPEAALSCYLIIFLMKPDAVENIGVAFGLIGLATIVLICTVPLINATVDSPLLRMLAIAIVSFAFLFLGAASQLGEIGGVIGLIIAFILTLLSMAPAGDVVTYALRSAWYLAAMPMALMVAFNLFLGLSPVRLLRERLQQRLATAAEAIVTGAPGRHEALAEMLRADNAALEQMAGFVRLLALTGEPQAAQIARDVRASWRLMLAASALPDDLSAARRDALAAAIRRAMEALEAGEMPPRPEPGPEPATEAEHALLAALATIAGAPEPGVVAAPKAPFLAPDVLSNPAYQRFALKTTAAAVICYVVYTSLDWQDIHTAMVTCYVAALGSTGETVHKLGLRITGCLIGAAMGMGAVLFVVPHLESVGGLMVLIFAGVLVGAWVSTGSERIAYGGVQIALAFLLIVLQGFRPSTSLDAGWDRIVGILLGNLVVYLISTRIWPVSVEGAARAHLRDALAGLARLATQAPEHRPGMVPDAALVAKEAGKADELLALLPFEPAAIRAAPATQAALRATSAEIAGLTRDIYFSREAMPDVAARLGQLGTRILGGGDGGMLGETGGPDALHRRLDRLQAAVAA
ncbi:FUSC family protein [Roseomonas marmotae]|uniref:FUSC family protein n=1 Tax=Roseomonas marmotae TaxID=2768161 RepID=A0ABS3KGN5_9PROT|nr:FUSC family protein [Roseomonas marmotae]MBO1076620.1 FUSC family protein [Roseomonas marmotae]QTI79637.1 FUSC family protein [Roseomonas marmotae]